MQKYRYIPGILTIVFFMVLTSISYAQTEVVNAVTAAISNGNSKELARYFSAVIDLTVPGNEGSYSKTQAEQIMKDFFMKQPTRTFRINHQGSSKDGSRFVVGTLLTTKGITYRTYFLLKKMEGVYYIQQFQLEAD